MARKDTRRVQISEIVEEAPGIRRFILVDPHGEDLAGFEAGAHIDVHVGEIVRQYSLCNRPGDTDRYEIAVRKDEASRGGSSAMHALTVGEAMDISGPRNNFKLASSARRSLLFAGGIGITPLLSMAEHLYATRCDFELHYCTRSANFTAFADRIRRSGFAGAVQFYHDDGPSETRLSPESILALPDSESHIYVCGPKAFMDWILDAARRAGWEEQQLHLEYFSAETVLSDTETDREFEVQIASTGAVITVASDQTVLSALAKAGINLPSSCENGVCGTCLTGVRDGQPDHRDMYLSPEEQERGDQFTPCCSRSCSPRLVLDL